MHAYLNSIHLYIERKQNRHYYTITIILSFSFFESIHFAQLNAQHFFFCCSTLNYVRRYLFTSISYRGHPVVIYMDHYIKVKIFIVSLRHTIKMIWYDQNSIQFHSFLVFVVQRRIRMLFFSYIKTLFKLTISIFI